MSTTYRVTLTPDERAQLDALLHAGTAPVRTFTHAHILLKADTSGLAGPAWDDADIATAFTCSLSTIHRVRQLFVEHDFDTAVHRARPRRSRLPKLDGEQEAHLLAVACSSPPPGRARWSLRLLADQFVALGYETAISHETIRRVLKKTK